MDFEIQPTIVGRFSGLRRSHSEQRSTQGDGRAFTRPDGHRSTKPSSELFQTAPADLLSADTRAGDRRSFLKL